jgi:hypothetical protein
MNARTRENLRILILTALHAARPYGVEVDPLRLALPPHLRGLTVEDLRVEIDYLVGKGLVEPATKRISPENGAWRLTAEGTDYLATEGLA